MTNKRWLTHVIFYLLWLVLLAVGFWFMFLSREAVLIILAHYAGDSFVRLWRAGFLDKAFFLFMGLAVLVYFYATEGYLRDGIEKRDLLRRFFKTAGWALLVVFTLDLLLLALQRFAGGVWLRWLILVAELGLGLGLSWRGRRKPAIPVEPLAKTGK